MESKLVILLIVTCLTPTALGWRSFVEDQFGRKCINGSVGIPPDYIVCSRDKNLVCSSKSVCECSTDPTQKVEYDLDDKACLPVPYAQNEFRCQTNSQCKVSSYGQFSRCNVDIGRCECYAGTDKVELVEQRCYVVKPVPYGYTFPTCDNDLKCRDATLGQLSRCNMAQNVCECYDTVSNGKNDVGYNDGVCIYKRKLGEYCESDESCQIGYHVNAVCVPTPGYLGEEKTCQCPSNRKCDGDPNTGSGRTFSTLLLVIGVTTVLMGLVATKVVN